jgi:hypothetical protein
MYLLYSAINASVVLLGSGSHLDDCEATIMNWYALLSFPSLSSQICRLSVMRNVKLNQMMVDSVFGFSRTLKVLKGTTCVLGKFDDDFNFQEYHLLPPLFIHTQFPT